jgi:DNA polymerase-3 subunit delta'
MNEKAQNAFLKTLEEPPPNTYFILATANPSALLPTIRSRCQPLIMLENQCKYDFEGSDELFMALHELFFASGNLTKAENCASNIIGIANGLQQKAGEDTDEKWSEKLETAKTLESPARKQIEKRHQAAANAEYLQSRSYFLSAIHTWFAQIYQLASGVPSSNLANPEILLSAPPDNIDEEKAFKALDRTGKLLQNLRWSINEELAIREFCLNIALDN